MGLIRRQEERLAIQLLSWQYQRRKLAVPAYPELERQAAKLVDEAHRIAKERGRNVMAIVKDLAGDLKNEK